MLHGGGTSYRGVLPTAKEMAKVYHVVLAAYDGFNSDEPETEFKSPMDEAKRLGDYIVEHYDGKIDIFYGVSYGNEEKKARHGNPLYQTLFPPCANPGHSEDGSRRACDAPSPGILPAGKGVFDTRAGRSERKKLKEEQKCPRRQPNFRKKK